jgi:proline iminopeptidase
MTTIDPQASVNGAELHVELQGPDDAPALVILHGGPGVGDSRDQVRDFGALADEHRLLFYDARGSGRSSDTPPYTHEQWVDDLDALTRRLGIERFALAGHSYGGIVAQEYALRHQERLTRLVLIDTAASTIDNEVTIRRALDAGIPGIEEHWLRPLFEGRVASDEEMHGMWERLLPLYFEGDFDPALPKAIADQTYFHHATHNQAFSVNNPGFDVRDRLGEIAVPTLVMCGGQDWITPVERAREIVAGIPGSRLEVFEQSGHMPMTEEPEAFLRVLRAFLAEGRA